MMTASDILLLLPAVIVAASAVAVMLVIAWRRHHGLAVFLAALGLAAGFVSACALFPSPDLPRQITPLLRIDRYALFFTGLVLAASLAVALFSYGYFKIHANQREEFYVLLLAATLGAAALTASVHFASFFLGLETLTVSLYGMAAYRKDSVRSVEAGVKYLILAAVSSAFILFGMALVYAATGTLSFAGAAAPGGLAAAGLVLIVAGAGFKLAVVPFHLWTPDVYEGAPAPATAFIATVSKAAVFAASLRLLAAAGLRENGALMTIVAVVAVLSMLAGNLLALFQANVKRMLAYSSIAHLGYLLVALLAGGPRGTAAAAFYLAAYVVSSLGAFGVVSVLSGPVRDADRVEDYRGLARRRPWTAVVFALMLLSLAGLPLTAGFFGKFFLVAAGVSAGVWAAVAALAAGSVIGIFYYFRLISALFGQPGEEASGGRTSLTAGGALAVLTVLLLWLGAYPGPLLGLVQRIIRF